MSSPQPTEQVEVVVVDEADVLHTVGKSWGIVFGIGILSIILGAVFLIWPGKTLLVIAVVFGIYLIVSGIVQLVQGFNKELSGGQRTLSIIVGIISLILGVLCFRGGLIEGVYILSLFVGFSFLFRGLTQFIAGVQAKGSPSRVILLILGVLGVIVGIVVLVAPFNSLVVLAYITGIWLIVMGLLEVIYAWQFKKATGN